jgi:hypothetical protein
VEAQVTPKILLAASIMAVLAMTCGQAQMGPVKANIPFQFVAEGKTFPAGQYEFIRDGTDRNFQVVGPGTRNDVIVPIITRLGGSIHTTPQDSHIVFDNVNGTYILSELWIPGMDGFVLHITQGKHEHRTVTTPR